MQIVKFDSGRDLDRLEAYLRDRFFETGTSVSWLPERLHDLIYRVGMQEADEGRTRSADFIYLWVEHNEIEACVLPDGENIYASVRRGREQLFPAMVEFSERNCLPLFREAEDGSVKFWFAIDSGQTYMQDALLARGYERYPEREYLNCVDPAEADVPAALPNGFRLLYGEEYPNEENKWSALRLSFHPDWEAPDYTASMRPYLGRKRSSMYRDSFECVVADTESGEKNNVCAYCFVWVDARSRTAMIEPVGTREKYLHRGFGTAMMRGALSRCASLGVRKCYADSFGGRKDFYAAAGFRVETSIGFWYKTLRPRPVGPGAEAPERTDDETGES
jgi:GNAT superfamily N-acetyltransferase